MQDLKILKDGPEFDRQWMIVDETGKFLTQRDDPRLAQIKTFLLNSLDQKGQPLRQLYLQIEHEQFVFYDESTEQSAKEDIQVDQHGLVEVWRNSVTAIEVSKKISDSLSVFLNRKVKLVKYLESSARPAPSVKFADSLSVLVTSLKSLEELNRRLLEKGLSTVPMNRFRPNIVMDGLDTAFVEDQWSEIFFANKNNTKENQQVVLKNSKPCSRCVIINIDQESGLKKDGEPLKTLSSFRQVDRKINFGVLFEIQSEGVLQIGDGISIKS